MSDLVTLINIRLNYEYEMRVLHFTSRTKKAYTVLPFFAIEHVHILKAKSNFTAYIYTKKLLAIFF